MGNQICAERTRNQNYMPSQVKPVQKQAPEEYIQIPQLTSEAKEVLANKSIHSAKISQKQTEFKKKVYGGDIYLGEISSNGFPHGVGMMYRLDRSYFLGIFDNGVASGEGLYLLADGSYYEGNIKDNTAECLEGGVYHCKQFTYEGGFYRNKFQGKGSQVGRLHEFAGVYQQGHRSYGQLIWWQGKEGENTANILEAHKDLLGSTHMNKSVFKVQDQAASKIRNQSKYQWKYIGSFDQLNKFTGEGTLVQPQGKYVGSFIDGKKHGRGVYYHKNTDIYYEGGYFNGLKEGLGRASLTSTNQIVFRGQFKNGVPSGKGFRINQGQNQIPVEFVEGINILALQQKTAREYLKNIEAQC